MKLAAKDSRPSLPIAALLTAALMLLACDEGTSGGGAQDAGGAGAKDTATAAGPEAKPDGPTIATDARPDDDAGAAPDTRSTDDLAPTNRDGAATPPDQRPRDAAPTDQRASDLAPNPDGPAAGDVAPPNNGGVSGLTVVAANSTVGLDWPRQADATKYRVYWDTATGAGRGGQVIENTEPTLVHRGLTNGTTYYYTVAAVTPAGEGELSAEASATPGGEWVLEELGAGDFDDVATGGRISRLPIKDRIHILLLAEGYLETELAKLHDLGTHNGTRANDVDRWLDEVFAIEPYRQFRSAFAVWYLPRASAAHLGEGTTAFGVTTSGGGVSTVTAVPTPLFAVLDGTGPDAFPFPPDSPVVNHVAAFLLYDPARGRAGVSGVTTTLQNPADRNQRIAAAFGIGHAHEFTHAFASLRDEYLETTNSPRAASETGNTSPSNACSTLPWAHLLYGAGINTTQELVGAFGTAELGYHPELKCLLNGTHDNGQFFCQATSSGSYPNLTLRTDDRMCNFCRELTAYRVFDRARILPGTSGFATWKTQYRTPFYQRYGFKVPATVPQTLKCPEDTAARPVFQDCVP